LNGRGVAEESPLTFCHKPWVLADIEVPEVVVSVYEAQRAHCFIGPMSLNALSLYIISV
jgi:hypothetical protein